MIKLLTLGYACILVLVSGVCAQNLDTERELHQQILKNLKKDVEENYFDPKLKGVDLGTAVKKASDLVAGARSVEEMDDIVARVLMQFDDSHLIFAPPERTVLVKYGWHIQMIGDKAFVTDVADDSDAKKKGIRPGDQIYMLEGFIPTRSEFQLLKYHYEILAPQPRIVAVIVKPDGRKYKVEIEAKVERQSVFKPTTRDLNLRFDSEFLKRTRQEFYDEMPGLAIWKIPTFEFSDIKVAKMMDRVKNASALVLDLRGNEGGLVYSLEELIKAFFEKDVNIGKAHYRKETYTNLLKGDGKKAYSGKLVVLIDSESASAAEVFARVVQLEKRGTVIGDRSSGQVMAARLFPHYYGMDDLIGYGFSVTVGDLEMKDGGRLEKVGVTPDEIVIPSAKDMSIGRDPALARAVESLGFQMSPEVAGAIFKKEK
ncbi:MAG: S41 family peptidase [Acidobacteriota bacterium]